MRPSWQLALRAGSRPAAETFTQTARRAVLDRKAEGAPGLVSLRLFDKATGAALKLIGLWPTRALRLIDPEGQIWRGRGRSP